jgi:hypothetical protein
MGPFCDRQRRWKPAGLLGLALIAWLAPLAGVRAADSTFYSNKRDFFIPFQTDPTGPRLQRVFLHYSLNSGSSYSEWGSAGPADKGFKFRATRDGWYWFAVQTQDTAGLKHPPTLDYIQPALKVCVDTQPPSVVLRSATPTTANAAIEWDVRDDLAGVDLNTLRVEYSFPGARDAVPLPVAQVAVGSYQWNLSGAGPATVRLTVRDKAGNLAEQSITMTPGGASTSPGVGPGTSIEPRPGDATIVNSKSFSLTYQIEDVGVSKVKSIEVYMVRGNGLDWEKLKDEMPSQDGTNLKVSVTVPDQGRYGFKLIARSGADLSEPPPKKGDRPDLWVEVDTEPPDVKIGKLEMGKGQFHGKLTIRWTATDKHMGTRPIRLSYQDSDKTDSPWVVFAENLPNDGTYVWDISTARDKLASIFKVKIKVEAVDQAGNVGSAVSNDSVPTDLSIPRAKIIGASGVSKVEVTPQ